MPLINKAGGGGADTTVVTATAADVLAGKVIVDADGNEITGTYVGLDTSDATASAADILSGETAYVDGAIVTGTMANRGAVSQVLNTSMTSYTVPEGYHNGSGTVSIVTETTSVTPTKSEQTIVPSSGKVLTSVSVGAISDTYQDVTGVTAAAADVLSGKVIVDASGNELAGTMTDNGAVSGSISTKAGTYTIPEGYHNGSGSVGISSTEKAKIIASNIKSGVSILGVQGSYVGELVEISGKISSSNGSVVISDSNITSTSKLVAGIIEVYSGSADTLDVKYAYVHSSGYLYSYGVASTDSSYVQSQVKVTYTSGKLTLAPSNAAYGFTSGVTYSYTFILS